MATYPAYPDNKIIVDGVDIATTFQMVLLDGYTLEPPEPKTYKIDIPGGNGVIDLTDAFAGDVVYNNRSQSFTYALIDMGTEQTFEEAKTKVSNFLHGKAFDYKLSFDPDYTYHGRFSVSSYSHAVYQSGILGTITIDVDADPYKYQETRTYNVNAIGGRMFMFWCGRLPVHPTIECDQACTITWDGTESVIPAGSYVLNDVLFTQGVNELYINSYHIYTMTWAELAEDGDHAMTWDDANKYRWDGLHLIKDYYDQTVWCWQDLNETTWADLADNTWNDENLSVGTASGRNVYLEYKWGDL